MRAPDPAYRRRPAGRLLLATAVAACFAWAGAAHAAGTHVITVDATVLSKNSCSFSLASSTINLSINPAGTSTASATDPIVFRCIGSASPATYSISNNSGLHGSSPSALRMQNASGAYLPYSLSYPASGSTPKNTDTTITVTASVSPSDYQVASSGTYTDSVVLTISP